MSINVTFVALILVLHFMQTTTVATAEKLRLTKDEFELIEKILGRNPNFTELCAFSGMWSEHCSYKNSIKWLKTLPRDGEKMLVKAGEENAGLMDIGDGYGVVFKIESHNHPSALEPFQGAATGVGGIHRDIFTMGARPIAALNSLRFGNITDSKNQHLLKGVVKGIGHYGNCFGVPTVGGEVYFEDCYSTNPLVNAMSVGIVKAGKTVSATAEGIGNTVMYVGSATGKDGIGGASFASADITSDSVQELPAVQVGDPFQEKKLLEACLEVLETTNVVVGMQDMGAAGIICSTAEMSAKGKVGMRIDLEKVPTRQQNMQAWELLLSESQERMLMVVEKGKEAEVKKIFDKWDLPCAAIGTVTNDGILSFYLNDLLEAALPAESLVLGGGAPQYERSYKEPAYLATIKAFDAATISQPNDYKNITAQLIALPNIASKKWIYTQYDSMVGTVNSSTNHASDAAIVLVKETGKGIAVTTDCNSRYVYANPKVGGMIAVAEAARNIVCSGGQPLGVTNCLNFGNPYNEEVYYQFVNAVTGMGEACKAFNTPVTGGNVSFYNQNPEGAVYPTPTIGMVGLVDNLQQVPGIAFKQAEDCIIILGKLSNDINSSEYLHKLCKVEHSDAPYFNIEEELKVQALTLAIIKNNLASSVHDISEGGLIVNLLESSFGNGLGFTIECAPSIRKDAFLFGEAQGRVVVSCGPSQKDALMAIAEKHGVPTFVLGTVSNNINVDKENWDTVTAYHNLYQTSLEQYLN
jgi:phosphoribosylformylglycinamidine synthase subunit PurL